MLMNQTLSEQLSCFSSAPGAQPLSTCTVGYLVGEAAAVLSQPGYSIAMCGARLPSSENRKVLQGGEDEECGYREKLKQIWELHSQLQPGQAEFRAQESL